DRVAEVARPDPAIDDPHSVAVGIQQVERELLAGGIVAVALLVQTPHDLDDAAGSASLLKRKVGSQSLLEGSHSQSHEHQSENAGDPVAFLHWSLSLRETRRSRRQT